MPIHTAPAPDGTIMCGVLSYTRRTLPVDNPDGSASCSACGLHVATAVAA